MAARGATGAFEQNLRGDPAAKLVLIGITEGSCGDDETYMIDIGSVARLAGIGEETVFQKLEKLEAMKLISKIQISKNETLYRLNGAV